MSFFFTHDYEGGAGSGTLPRVPEALILRNTTDGVTTLTMNNPTRLNGWTKPMMEALARALDESAADAGTQAVVLTGAGDYYCAGVNLGGTLSLDHPRRLHEFIRVQNQRLFDMFLDFPKPIVAAVNGPAIGACVTSATLCNAVIAAERATFSTPFAALGVPPEGCSSVVFPKLLGPSAARMLGPEGWTPSGKEAVDIGLAHACVPDADLLDAAHRKARSLVQARVGRTFPAGLSRDELKEVNARESRVLASAFLKHPFLLGQFKFLWRKNKTAPALTFLALAATRPVWKYLLPKDARRS